MQAKVIGLALAPDGKRTVTLLFGDPQTQFDKAIAPRITIGEDELSLLGVRLGDVLNVEFTAAAEFTEVQAKVDAYSRQARTRAFDKTAAARPDEGKW